MTKRMESKYKIDRRMGENMVDRKAQLTGVSMARANMASGARANSPITACSSKPSRSCVAITGTSPSGSSGEFIKKLDALKATAAPI